MSLVVCVRGLERDERERRSQAGGAVGGASWWCCGLSTRWRFVLVLRLIERGSWWRGVRVLGIRQSLALRASVAMD